MEKIFVPPIKIQGIKTKLVPLIQQKVSLSTNSVWIEPFMGSGVVGFNIGAKKAIFADINPYVIDFYQRVKMREITSHSVRASLENHGKYLEIGDAEYYYSIRDRFNQCHDAMDFLFLNRACFNGMIRFNKKHEFNVPYGHKPQRFSKAYVTKVVNQVKYVEQMLKTHDWSFVCQPFEETISMAGVDDFIYCDPPYIGRHVDYFDSWDANEELALRNALVNSGAKFMLSTWDHNDYRQNDYIRTIWSFCNIVTHEHFYHVGAKETNRAPVVEALLTNYSLSDSQNEVLLQEPRQLSFL